MRFRQHQAVADVATWRLLALFVLLLALVVLVVNGALALGYRVAMPMTGGYPRHFFATNTAITLLFVLGGVVVESMRMRDGGTHVAHMIGARPAQTSASSDLARLERRFVNIVNELSIAHRVPQPPQAWVLPRDDAINALAAGWTPGDQVVVVTRGALERLTREELQGVVAHELAHLRSGDIALCMRLIGLVWGLQLIHGFGRSLLADVHERRLPLGVVFGALLIGVGWVGWAAGRLLQAGVSRQREYHADATAVAMTRQVAGLGGALRKIAAQVERATDGDADHARDDALLEPQTESVAHLLLHHRSALFATHPPIAERLRRLYGRSVLPVRDEVQPPEPDEGLMALAPAQGGQHKLDIDLSSGLPAQRQAAPIAEQGSARAPHQDVVHADDATLAGRVHDELIERAGRWHGPIERRAATLALLLDADDPTAWARWAAMVNHPMIAARLRTELNSVAPATRLELLRLLGAKAAPDAAQTQLLHQEARSLATTPRAVLRRLAWHRMTTSKRLAHADAERWLQPDELQRDVEIVSRELAVLVAAKQADAWLRLALEAWGAAPASASASASHPTATAKASLLLRDLSHIDGIAGVKHGAPMSWTQALRRISRLSPMARPQLMRAWSQATAALGLADNLAAVETLMCVCTALDTPYVPPTSVGLPSVKSAKSVTHAAATTHSPPDARREASPTIG